jgi:hypothetical protein
MVKNQEEDPGLTETGTMWVIVGFYCEPLRRGGTFPV